MKSVSIHFKATHCIFTSSITSPWSQCHTMPQWYFHIIHNIITKSLSIFFKTPHGIFTIHYVTTKSLSSHRLPHHHEVTVDLLQNNPRYPHHPWHHHDVTVITSSTTWNHEVTVDLFQNNTRYPHHPRHHHEVPSHVPPSPCTIHHHHEGTVNLFLQNDHCGSFVYTFKTQHTGALRQSKPHLPCIRQIPTILWQQRTQPLFFPQPLLPHFFCFARQLSTTPQACCYHSHHYIIYSLFEGVLLWQQWKHFFF